MEKFKLDTTSGIILCKAKLTNNNKKSIMSKLAVDTGATFTMVSVETALAIDIDPSKSTYHIEINTVNGTILTSVIKIPIFECFGVKIRNLEVICHNLPPESPVEGLLGLNFLKKAMIIINFSKNIIEIPTINYAP